MEIELNQLEARVLGAFIEKELTTPDYYPLSLNGLTNACNQKSNRAPVLQLEESEVLETVEQLRQKRLAMQSQGAGSRVTKFRHTLRERLYLEDHELAILAELLLRGAQTPGELRSRAGRMANFSDLSKVDETLQELIEKEPPMVVKLARQAGRKENRYMHLFCGAVADDEAGATELIVQSGQGRSLTELEEEIEKLKSELAELKLNFQQFREQFD